MSSWIDVKYIQLLGVQLKQFKQKRDNLWNFRCPICGDSEKNEYKARGYIFYKSPVYMYKCQNCGDARPFVSLLKYVSPELHKQYRLEVFKENNTGATKKRMKFNRKSRKPKATQQKTKAVQKPKQLREFKCLSELDDDHIAVQYARSRRIPADKFDRLYFADCMEAVADVIGGYETTRFDKFPRLLLPFINRSGVLTHIQGRAIGDDVPNKSRYYTLEVEEEPKVFGMDSINYSKMIKVVEGPIDSLFLDNCVGMGGADIPWNLFDPKNTLFIWDNEPRSRNILKRMYEAADRGFHVCVWGKSIRQKDINDMILSGMSHKQLEDYIRTHTHRGLRARAAISHFKVF